MAKRLRLNSLSRYAKESERLVLETHSAGCGGIVLRWRDPDDGVPIFIVSHSSFELEPFVDGKQIGRRFILPPGEHVLGFICTPPNHTPSVAAPNYVGCTATLDGPGSTFMDAARIPELVTSNRWKCSTTYEEGWGTLEFDDARWESMTPLLESPAPGFQYLRRRVEDAGGNVLETPDETPLYIRYRFVLGEHS